ncbi:TetR/AcrR family transcriptional regulator [Corynebacterium anserum]|uniref:TetR family transcriptional regulator n=1 Tax=Corynebacterium anserum TaxID=2684406 RepID=A0A7G7YLX2_9CORY|nr:TetR/AcrR family transcriptional regulator [Corynebacterium anserum]MBC2681341.1 TetR family transcriptional regulator [Corynebacterium anserum]QNH95492.1 TetR family transcriptional regulator [Corynebacterium anserum]
MSRREKTMTAIVDAAEQLLQEGGAKALTAGAVAESVGLARNSLYRYVDSIDDLRGLVVSRHLPRMFADMQDTLESAENPEKALVDYVRANLRIAAESNHAWLIRITENISGSTAEDIGRMHRDLENALLEVCTHIDPDGSRMTADLINGVISVGFNCLEKNMNPGDVEQRCVEAVSAILTARRRNVERGN